MRPTLRLDKWLCFARFCKTRGIAAELILGHRVRLNGQRVLKPGHAVTPGDVLTLRHCEVVRLIRVLELGTRRGPAVEAQTLYCDLDEAREKSCECDAGQTGTACPLD
ncbi:RNA-binding S4 domain-containing protein [Pseudorhodobacter sp.]|uniref:RNA-binding S4 domain-containing protein n=1 Tax=Pseudorhodobacter sp. TaxID=1934400 RepID=UPI002649EEA6|nr:RNA-binding S4 domain-containing protein [Pseudorhodobacter sp.]MDN5787232.1 RNA-binding S4 domain-containing protein [Pseudorhodobacter sp.]